MDSTRTAFLMALYNPKDRGNPSATHGKPPWYTSCSNTAATAKAIPSFWGLSIVSRNTVKPMATLTSGNKKYPRLASAARPWVTAHRKITQLSALQNAAQARIAMVRGCRNKASAAKSLPRPTITRHNSIKGSDHSARCASRSRASTGSVCIQ